MARSLGAPAVAPGWALVGPDGPAGAAQPARTRITSALTSLRTSDRCRRRALRVADQEIRTIASLASVGETRNGCSVSVTDWFPNQFGDVEHEVGLTLRLVGRSTDLAHAHAYDVVQAAVGF